MLAVFLPSAQTFINITSRPSEKPTSNLDSGGQKIKLQLIKISTSHRGLGLKNKPCCEHSHGGAFSSSQDVKSRVRSGVVLCSCERSSSSRYPGFAQAAAWRGGDLTPVLTTLAHLWKDKTHFIVIHCSLFLRNTRLFFLKLKKKKKTHRLM